MSASASNLILSQGVVMKKVGHVKCNVTKFWDVGITSVLRNAIQVFISTEYCKLFPQAKITFLKSR